MPNRIRMLGCLLRLAAVAVGSHALAAQAPPKVAGSLDAGFVTATGNTRVVTTNVGDKLTANWAGWTFIQTLAQVYGKSKGVESANQLRAGVRAERKLFDAVGAFGAVQYERNPYAGFRRRFDELLGVEWKAIADSSDELKLDGGGVLTQQENTDGTAKNFPSARAAAAYKHTFKPKTYFSQGVEYLPDLEESGAYRFNSESAIVAPVSSRIGVKLTYVFQYNSRPPPKFGTTDCIFTSGLQLTF